jgi:DsbC/DsbD-like thiol-disulfide interchange protein
MMPYCQHMRFVRDSLLCGLLLLASPALAADTSGWAIDIRSAARLIAGTAPKGANALSAGVEFRMDPGWHTYWRYPGDSGIPPRFDFDASENVREAKVLYPGPTAFNDESGTSIGYFEHVVFPVIVTPKDPSKPVKLRLTAGYAVCEKLCVPAEAHLELSLTRGPNGFNDLIKAATARVPRKVSPQQAGLTVRRTVGAAKPTVEIDITGLPDAHVFVEGPTGEWALPIPKPIAGAPKGRFSFELDGLPPGVDPKAPLDLTFTIVGADRALETTTHLD